MYKLDFATMRQVMEAHQKTGSLSADLPAGLISRREACHIEITVQSGSIASCELQGHSGWSKMGAEAEAALVRLGPVRLGWTFTPKLDDVPSSEQDALLGEASSLIPRRTGRQVEQAQMRSWSALHRHVYACTDGRKSAAKMAALLLTPPDHIEKAMRDLQVMGVIDMASPCEPHPPHAPS